MQIFDEIDEQKIGNFIVRDILPKSYEKMVFYNVTTGSGYEYLYTGKPGGEVLQTERSFADIQNDLLESVRAAYAGDDFKQVSEALDFVKILECINQNGDCKISYSEYVYDQALQKELQRMLLRFVRFPHKEHLILMMTKKNITDEYDERRKKEEIAKLSLELAQRASLVRNDFLLNVSQDIREPLYGLNGMLSLATDHTLSKDQRIAYIEKAQTSASQLSSILYHMLDMSALDTGNKASSHKPILLREFLDKIAEMLEEVACKKNQKVIFEVEDQKLSVIMGDDISWAQIFMAIMGNSLAYGYENGYSKCSISSKWLDKESILATLVFTDDGPGISEPMLTSVFGEFVSTNQKMGAKGLGIPLAKSLIEKQGGKLWVENREEGGTRVTLQLRVEGASLAQTEQQMRIRRMANDLNQVDFENFKVLVVDDYEIGREITKLKLEHIGVKVDIATCARAALDMLEQSEIEEYHMIFMNAHMAIMDGLEATMRIRKMERKDLSDITIATVTSNVYQEERIRALEAGVDYHLPLPLHDDELKDMLVRELFDVTEKKQYELRGFRIVK